MSTWVLLRGLTREQRHWGEFLKLMEKEFPEARVVALDLPGNGNLHAVASPISIAAMAADCRTQLVKLDLRPPYNLLAMSLGAMVATAWADSHPEEVDACVLLSTSFGSFSPLHHRLRPSALPILLQLSLSRTAEKQEELTFKLTSGLPLPPVHLIDRWVAIRQSRPVSRWNALWQLIAAVRYQAPLIAPDATLVMVGAGDRLVNSRCSRAIAERWHCPIVIHPTAGHDLPLDDGVWVVKEVCKWLEGATALQGDR
jgi:pimeloyl-ACP methyl ester carboxylesterase